METNNTGAIRNFALGALVIAVIVLGFFLYQEQRQSDTIELKLEVPDISTQND